jgi:hypothetical protein
VPDLARNFISMGQLDEEGYSTVFGNGRWSVTKGALVVARGKKVGTLYLASNKNTIAVVDYTEDSKLWHNRLGHMSMKGVRMLASRGRLQNFKFEDFGQCEDCILGKQKRVSFSKDAEDRQAGVSSHRRVGSSASEIPWRLPILCHFYRRLHSEGLDLFLTDRCVLSFQEVESRDREPVG